MNKLTTGMIAGGIIGMLGSAYALSDKRTRRKMMKKASQMMEKIEDMM